MIVSIHAPTRGATRSFYDIATEILFQSTHPLGVRHGILILSIVKLQFQSTHPLGVRLKIPNLVLCVSQFQSTHPLGVRHVLQIWFLICLSFNPRTHSGCDSINSEYQHEQGKFQSTHPLGVRLSIMYTNLLATEFQSTHPLGVRLLQVSDYRLR